MFQFLFRIILIARFLGILKVRREPLLLVHGDVLLDHPLDPGGGVKTVY